MHEQISQKVTSMNQRLQEIGAILKQAREEQGKSIATLVDATKIRRLYVQAVEDGDVSQLPVGTYVQGYIRNMADYLGLDGAELVERYRDSFVQLRSIAETEARSLAPMNVHRDEETRPSYLLLLISIGFIFLCYGVWYFFLKSTPEIRLLTNIPSQNPSEVANPEGSFKTDTSAPQAHINNSNTLITKMNPDSLTKHRSKSLSNVVLFARDKTWIRILSKDNRLLLETTMDPGDTYFVPDEEGINIVSGHSHSVEVFIDGEQKGFVKSVPGAQVAQRDEQESTDLVSDLPTPVNRGQNSSIPENAAIIPPASGVSPYNQGDTPADNVSPLAPPAQAGDLSTPEEDQHSQAASNVIPASTTSVSPANVTANPAANAVPQQQTTTEAPRVPSLQYNSVQGQGL